MYTSKQQTKPALTLAALRNAFPAGSLWQVSPAIDQKKLEIALSSYGNALLPDICADTVLALYDSTLFGSGKKGALITGSGLVIGNSISADKGMRVINRMYVPFKELKEVSLKNFNTFRFQTFDTFEWGCQNAEVIVELLNTIMSSSSPVITGEHSDAKVNEGHHALTRPEHSINAAESGTLEEQGEHSSAKAQNRDLKQPSWYVIVLGLVLSVLLMWGISKVFGLWGIGVFFAAGALVGWLDDLRKKGNDELKRQFKVVSKFVVSGIGGGLGFLLLRFMGIPLYRLPDFKRVGAQDDWITVFISGLATGIMLAVLPALNSKNQKKNEK
jgi:hypothetical protein